MALRELKSHKSFGGKTQFWEHDSRETASVMRFSTFVPAQKPQGALIWLSGLTCTEENFIMKAGAQRALAAHHLMVICPDTSPRGLNLPQENDSIEFGTGASLYVDATTPLYRDHYRMKSYISQEIYQMITTVFGVPSDRISIFGHSMGGHGALVMGLQEPQKFQSLSALAPLMNPTQADWPRRAFKGYLGEDETSWKAYDATELVLKGHRHPHPILIDQGTADELFEKRLMTENFTNAALKKSQPLERNFREGYDHSYYFVSSFIDSHIEFHAKAIGRPRPSS